MSVILSTLPERESLGLAENSITHKPQETEERRRNEV